jgi:hypothetical protein
MVDFVRISQLPAATTSNLSDVYVVNQGTTTKKISGAVINASQTVENIAALRALSVETAKTVVVKGYYSNNDGGGGTFSASPQGAPGAYVDNGGTVIVPTGGNGSVAWLRLFDGPISVKWFGARGNDSADDRPAIVAALSEASNNDIFFPAGTYLISALITLAGNGRRINLANRAIIKRNFNTGAMFLVTGSLWVFNGGQLNGNKSNFSVSSNAGIFITGDNNSVQNMDVYDCKSHGLSIDGDAGGGFDNKILNNQVRNVDEVGISQFKARRSVITGNVILDAGAEGITIDVQTTGTRVANNIIVACGRIGAVGGIGIDDAFYNTIANNLIVETKNSLPGIGFQCNAGFTYHNTVVGNNIVSNTGYGIWLKRTQIIPPYPGAGSFATSDWNTITGNQFQNNTLAPVRIDQDCTGNVLSGNSYDGGLPSIAANAANSNRVDTGLVTLRVSNSLLRANVTGDGTVYQIPFDTVDLNRSATYNSTTGVFTAPVNGIYSLSAGARCVGGGLHDFMTISIVTSKGTFSSGVDYTDEANQNACVSGSIYLTSGDTVFVTVAVGGDTLTVDVANDVNYNFLTVVLLA